MSTEERLKQELEPIAKRLCKAKGWELKDFLGAGATAATFEVTTSDGLRALKIYAPHFLKGKRGEQVRRRFALVVARELSRSLDLADPPTADISADEFLVISGPDNGVTKFRTALRQVATISLRPGVVVQLSISDDERYGRLEEPSKASASVVTTARDRQEARSLEVLAGQLFPYIQNLLIKAGFEPHHDKRGSRKGRPPQLPLK